MNFKESLMYNNKLLFNKNINKKDKKHYLNFQLYKPNEFAYEHPIKKINISNTCCIIEYIKSKNNMIDITFEVFIEKIAELFGNFILYTSKDEDDNYFLLNKSITINNDMFELYNTTVYQKTPFKKLFSFISPNCVNNRALCELKKIDNLSNIYIKNSYDSIDFVLMYDNYKNKWRIITDKSLNGNDIYYKDNNNILIDDIIVSKNIDLDNLIKTDIYYLTYLHYKNHNIINKYQYGTRNKNIYMNFILNKDNELIMDCTENKDFYKNNNLNFKSIDEILININNISYENSINKKISQEGYLIYYFHDDFLYCYKLQTNIYQELKEIKKHTQNINQLYLELYQSNKLKEYLPFFTSYSSEIIHRISISVRTISKEFLDIYHFLKKQKNPDLYENIPNSFNKVLYNIHAIYIDSKKSEKNIDFDELILNKSITVHDIYHYIKSLSFNLLKQIYFDRLSIINKKNINNEIYILINKNCIYTMTQTILMMS